MEERGERNQKERETERETERERENITIAISNRLEMFVKLVVPKIA